MKDRPNIRLVAAGLLAVSAAAVWMIMGRPASDAARRADAPAAPVTRYIPPEPAAIAMSEPPAPADLPPPKPRMVHSPEALKDLDDVRFMLRDFRARLGGNPSGTNAEIMKEVMGANRVQLKLSPPEGQGLNEQGELVDRWGAPYFFHQLSSTEMEIRSAGPDGAMWTDDDIEAK